MQNSMHKIRKKMYKHHIHKFTRANTDVQGKQHNCCDSKLNIENHHYYHSGFYCWKSCGEGDKRSWMDEYDWWPLCGHECTMPQMHTTTNHFHMSWLLPEYHHSWFSVQDWQHIMIMQKRGIMFVHGWYVLYRLIACYCDEKTLNFFDYFIVSMNFICFYLLL